MVGTSETGEKLTDISHVRTKAKFQDFLRSQYSSRAFFIILVGNTCLNLATFQDDGDYTLNHSNYGDLVQAVLRYIVLALPLYIWMAKVDLSDEEYSVDKNYASNDSSMFIPWAQAAHPVLLSCLLALKVFRDSPGPEVLASEWSQFPSYGLLLLPMVTFFLLRDTKWEALLLTWGIALAVLVILCVRGQSSDMVYSFMTYTAVTGFLFLDATRQQKKMFLLMSKLQETLKVNEQLAVDAQALELRAMIGNVAHDLKTVSSNLFPLSVLLLVSHFFLSVFVPTAADSSS